MKTDLKESNTHPNAGKTEQAHTWRLNVGDEHTVMDHQQRRLVSVACGGMTGRTFAEAADCARLIAAAPALLAALVETADDLESEIEARRGTVLDRTMDRDLETVRRARAAINQARGLS